MSCSGLNLTVFYDISKEASSFDDTSHISGCEYWIRTNGDRSHIPLAGEQIKPLSQLTIFIFRNQKITEITLNQQ